MRLKERVNVNGRDFIEDDYVWVRTQIDYVNDQGDGDVFLGLNSVTNWNMKYHEQGEDNILTEREMNEIRGC